MSTRAEQKTQTRRAIMDAALRLSAERGFSSLSLRQIAKEAEIAPTSFYRHFDDLEDLGLALVDEVGAQLRRVVRQARRRVAESGSGSVVRTSIETFMEFATSNTNLFRLLLGEGAGNSLTMRNAVREEVGRFTSELIESLQQEADKQQRPLAHAALAAEAMVTIAFNLGASALDRSASERAEVVERIVGEVRIIMRGAEAMGAGWEP
ncbi:MAG: HTH-type transcriptional repressor FabR [Nannocystaceae bacterium]|nr:HTH-type transcriptional repressor FabR [bacterium]